MSWADIVNDARRGTGPLRHARSLLKRIVAIRMPVIRPIAGFFYAEREIRATLWPMFLKFIYREPLMRYRCAQVGKRLWLEGPIPLIGGNGVIRIGDDVRIGAQNAWMVGFKNSVDAEIVIGNRVHIGYRNVFSAAKSIRIGDDTILAPDVQIYDSPTHPLSVSARLRKEPAPLLDAAPVVVGQNCWIGTGATIMRGVTIGDGSIIGASSLVTRDVPPNSLAAGNPARIIRELPE
jgi:acetyltransferase-like isoleucine patch superfamily enzyme